MHTSLGIALEPGESGGVNWFRRLQELMDVFGPHRFRSPELQHPVTKNATIAHVHQLMKQCQWAGIDECRQPRLPGGDVDWRARQH